MTSLGGDSLDIGDRIGSEFAWIEGALTGSAINGEETLSFSVLANVGPMIETGPLEHAKEKTDRLSLNVEACGVSSPGLKS